MSKASEALRSAADCVDACVMSEAQLDIIELIAHHIKDRAMGHKVERCRETRLLLKMLDKEPRL